MKRRNPLVLALMAGYSVVILLITLLACRLSYTQQRGELLADLDVQLVRAANEYENLTQDFWCLYLPLTEQSNATYQVLADYAATEGELSPLQKQELSQVLRNIAALDDRVRWIAVILPQRNVQYAWFPVQNTLQPLGEDFPYWEELAAKQDVMELYAVRSVPVLGETLDTLAIAGGLPASLGDGCLVAGLAVDTLRGICEADSPFASLQFDISVQGRSLYSSGRTPYLPDALPEKGEQAILRTAEGERLVQVARQTTRWARVYYSVDAQELALHAHRYTLPLLGGVALLVAISLLLYGLTLRMMSHEIDILRSGLIRIGENHLDTCIEGKFRQSGFAEIAEAINAMTVRMKENIDRAYYYELKQKEAELQELQSKFNPHFLYNTLELFCARCYQNGDDETAELISQTAAIFRGFIGARTFVPLREELAFCKRYMALFRARYGDKVQVRYDFDSAVLEYGIIRNAFQPLIENYFVHGIDTTRTDNRICFYGHLRDDKTILITVEDNGAGMKPEDLERLNARLRQPIATEQESYGLKNLHQRLRLFYGEPCGLTVRSSAQGGLAIDLLILQQKCSPADAEATR